MKTMPLLSLDDVVLVTSNQFSHRFSNPPLVTKNDFFQVIAHHFAQRFELDEASVSSAFLEREELGTTALGRGIFLPHGRFKALKQAHAFFMRVTPAVPLDAADNMAVDLVLALIFPPQAVQKHLDILAHAAQMFSQTEVCTVLRHAPLDQVFSLLATHLNKTA